MFIIFIKAVSIFKLLCYCKIDIALLLTSTVIDKLNVELLCRSLVVNCCKSTM